MKSYKIILCITFAFFSKSTNAQFNFQRSWGTYFGDERFALSDSKIDSNSNLYIVGTVEGTNLTNLTSFTNSASYQQNYGGGDYDGFIIKFNPLGQIVWGTFFGGNNIDKINSLDIDNNNNIYIIGSTSSNNNIATVGSFQENIVGGGDYFMSKFTPSGSIVWSTYFGGEANEITTLQRISFDGINNIYISGTFFSSNMATTGVFQETPNNSSSQISKFDLNGNRIWTTYYGRNNTWGLKANNYGVYVSGNTLDCPPNNFYNTYYGTSNGFKPLPENCREIYLSKFNSNGQRDWSTYYGGNQSEGVNGVNSIGLKDDKVFLAGTSPNYINQEVSTINTYQPNSFGPSNFIAQFNQDGTRNWGTYNGNYSNSSNVFPFSQIEVSRNSNTFFNYGSTGMDNNISTTDGYLTTTNSQYSSDAYICKFTDQNTKSWGTYYGGELDEKDISFHPYENDNKFYIVGSTQSLTQISTANGLQQTKQVFDIVNNTQQSAFNIFIAHFEPNPLSNTNFTDSLFSIFPNPNDGNFTISLKNLNNEIYTFELFDLIGKKLFTQKINNLETNINANYLCKGIYIAKISNSENISLNTKIVVE